MADFSSFEYRGGSQFQNRRANQMLIELGRLFQPFFIKEEKMWDVGSPNTARLVENDERCSGYVLNTWDSLMIRMLILQNHRERENAIE